MNFQELLSKIKAIDENTDGIDSTTELVAEPSTAELSMNTPTADVGECGEMPISIGRSEAPKQSDSVTMNVSMNGSGAGGIKDLMSILRSIEQGDNANPHSQDVSQLFVEPGHEEPIMGNMVNTMDRDMEEVSDSSEGKTWGNSTHDDAGAHTSGVSAVTASGDDLNRSKAQYPRAANPSANPIQEGLVERLQNLYNEIKTRSLNEGCLQDPHKHALAHILMADRHGHTQLETTGQAPHDLYEKLYDYYWDDMPSAVKKHPEHKVRHDHVVQRCKTDMMTPECQGAMSAYTPTRMAAPVVSIAEDQDIEQD